MSTRTQDSIGAFWGWWSIHRGEISSAIDNGTVGRWVPELTRMVHAMDHGLAWELMPGSRATHALVVTAEGKDELIGIAEAWLSGAPSGDATWEYHGSRPPGPLDLMTVGGLAFELGEVRGRWTPDHGREQLDVGLWHPAWAEASPGQLVLLSELFLDRLLGEVDKQRWIGAVEAIESASGGADPSSLRAAVEALAGTATRQKWLTAERRAADGRPVLVTYNEALKRIDHPQATWLVVVEIDRDEIQVGAGSASSGYEDLVARLEEHSGRLAAVVTDAHRRSLHFVVDPADGTVATAMQWARQVPNARVEANPDPGWHFREALFAAR